MSDTEAMSERELADYFQSGALSGEPRSVGEALAAADAGQEVTPAEIEEGAPQPPPEGPPVTVSDTPSERDIPPDIPGAELEAEPEPEPEVEDEDLDTVEDENVVWAKSKYGDDPTKWAQAARHQEQHISRLANELKEAQALAVEWAEYAQGIQAQAQQTQQMAMPLSASEEEWIERSLVNPYQAAQQAAYQGNVNLFNGILARVAEENPAMAAQIGSQVQMEMQQMAVQQNGVEQAPPPSLAESLAGSIQALGIDLDTYGEPMSAKIGELGEYDPYVQAILNGSESERVMALRAVYDLVRSTAMSTRKVRSTERDEQIKHEGELRRQAAGVVTGGPQQQEQPKQSGFMSAMEQEWRDRGQWSDE